MRNKGLLKKGCVYAAAAAIVTGAFTMPAYAAWGQNEKGAWQYETENGNAIGWQLIDGDWYFFNQEGDMLSGLANINGKVYYLGEPNDGAMKTGEVEINGLKFQFNEQGEAVGDLIPNTNIEYSTGGYSGWRLVNGKWQYINPQGKNVTGWLQVNGKWYFLNEKGEMMYGVVSIDGKIYYLGTPETGAMETGEVEINGRTYHFAETGEATGRIVPKPDAIFTVGENGVVTDITNVEEEDEEDDYEEDDVIPEQPTVPTPEEDDKENNEENNGENNEENTGENNEENNGENNEENNGENNGENSVVETTSY